MKRRKKAASFIAVLPASLLVSCQTPTPPPDPPIPPLSYGPRKKLGDECTVLVSGNPPYQIPVSCTAPIEPPLEGETWCRVESKEDPSKKVPVACEEEEPRPPSSNTNPPVPVTEPSSQPNHQTPLLPPVTYGPRVEEDGECTVRISGNPPFDRPVSCTAPIEPPLEGETWCRVESKEDPSKKVPVACEEGK